MAVLAAILITIMAAVPIPAQAGVPVQVNGQLTVNDQPAQRHDVLPESSTLKSKEGATLAIGERHLTLAPETTLRFVEHRQKRNQLVTDRGGIFVDERQTALALLSGELTVDTAPDDVDHHVRVLTPSLRVGINRTDARVSVHDATSHVYTDAGGVIVAPHERDRSTRLKSDQFIRHRKDGTIKPKKLDGMTGHFRDLTVNGQGLSSVEDLTIKRGGTVTISGEFSPAVTQMRAGIYTERQRAHESPFTMQFRPGFPESGSYELAYGIRLVDGRVIEKTTSVNITLKQPEKAAEKGSEAPEAFLKKRSRKAQTARASDASSETDNSSLKKVQQANKALREQIQYQNRELDHYQSTVQKLRDRLDELPEQYEKRLYELQKKRRALRRKNKRLQKRNRRYGEKLTAIRAEKRALKDSITTLRRALKKAPDEQDFQALHSKLATLKEHGSRLRNSIDELDRQREQLAKRLDASASDADDLKQKLQSVRSTKVNLKQQLDRLEDDKAALQDRLAELRSAAEKQDDARKKLSSLKDRLDRLVKKGNKLKQHLNETRQNNEKLRDKLSSYRTTNKALRDKLKQARTKVDSNQELRKRHEQLRNKLTAFRSKHKGLRRTARNHIRSLVQERNRAIRGLAEVTAQKGASEAQAMIDEGQQPEQGNSLARLVKYLSDLGENSGASSDELYSALHEAQSRARVLRTKLRQLKQHQVRYQKLKKKTENLSSVNEGLRTQLAHLKKRIRTLTDDSVETIPVRPELLRTLRERLKKQHETINDLNKTKTSE